MKTREIVTCGFLAAILLVVQVMLSFLPNIELVSLLVIVYTLVFQRKTLVILYTFALLQGLLYGFGIWWIMYLYVWTILYGIVRKFRKNENVILWAIIGGCFGALFGLFCSIPYAVAGGIGAGLAWWAGGLLFDIAHAVGNFFVILLLFKPLYYIVKKTNPCV